MVVKYFAKRNNIYCSYQLETWRKYYEIWTNNDRRINWPIMLLEFVNIAWAITGTVLNNVPEGTKDGAIGHCMKDYGMMYALMGYLSILFGYLQIVRMCLYIIFMMYHQRILGYLEARFRTDLINEIRAKGAKVVEMKFRIIPFDVPYSKEHDASRKEVDSESSTEEHRHSLRVHEGANEVHVRKNVTCAICCVDFKAGESLACLPCVVNIRQRTSRQPAVSSTSDLNLLAKSASIEQVSELDELSPAISRQHSCILDDISPTRFCTNSKKNIHCFEYMHTFHPPCIKEWLIRSNECPLCK